jgi:hypothetical protein
MSQNRSPLHGSTKPPIPLKRSNIRDVFRLRPNTVSVYCHPTTLRASSLATSIFSRCATGRCTFSTTSRTPAPTNRSHSSRSMRSRSPGSRAFVYSISSALDSTRTSIASSFLARYSRAGNKPFGTASRWRRGRAPRGVVRAEGVEPSRALPNGFSYQLRLSPPP